MPHPLNCIRALRARLSPPLRQADLARRIGCDQSDISAYELGKVVPDLPRAFDIAAALGRPVDEVFYGVRDARLHRLGGRIGDGSVQS